MEMADRVTEEYTGYPENMPPQKNDVKVLGITGGVGAGKSTILTYLKEKYGVRILEADAIGHLVQQPKTPCWRRIVDTFGTDILQPDRTIDRGKLGAIVYADRLKLDELNAIVHPAVKAYICREITRVRSNAQSPDKYAGSCAMDVPCNVSETSGSFTVIEAALLLEDHYDEICDEIWYIHANEQVREERLMRSRGYSREKVRQIMENQLKEEEFRSRCRTVIDNSADNPGKAYEQIDQALRKFLTT